MRRARRESGSGYRGRMGRGLDDLARRWGALMASAGVSLVGSPGGIVASNQSASGYPAGASSRLRKDYARAMGSGDYALEHDREAIVQFSRALDRCTIVYRPFLRRVVDFVIGRGLWPRARGGSPADAAVAYFRRWGDDAARADVKGGGTWPMLQRRAYLERLLAGDVLAIKAIRPDTGPCIQIIEAERIRSDGGQGRVYPRSGQNLVTDGVEVDSSGRPLAFFVASWDATGATPSVRSERVEADRCCFLAQRDAESMTRGVPPLACALERLAMLDENQIAMDAAVKIAAMFALVIKSRAPAQTQSMIRTGRTTETGSGDDPETVTRDLASVGPGMIMHLEPDEDAATVQGAQPTAGYGAYEKTTLRLIAALVGYPVEIVLGDLSTANFSVGRMAQVLSAKTAGPERSEFRSMFCAPIYRFVVAHAVASGALPLPESGDIDDYLDVTWPDPPIPMLQPEVEQRALIEGIEANLISKDDAIIERGGDPDQVRADRAREKAEEERLGIVPPRPAGSTSTDAASGGETASESVEAA